MRGIFIFLFKRFGLYAHASCDVHTSDVHLFNIYRFKMEPFDGIRSLIQVENNE